MSVSVLGIDIAKQKFDAALLVDGKTKHKTCKNSTEGFEILMLWLEKQGVQKVHACLEATGNCGGRSPHFNAPACHIQKFVSGENKKTSVIIPYHDHREISFIYFWLKSSSFFKGGVLLTSGRNKCLLMLTTYPQLSLWI
jgi:hypothetical protein